MTPRGHQPARTADPRPDADFPADPYPGVVPPTSFVHVEGASHVLTARPWRVGGLGLDAWLARRGAPPATARLPVLTYGSNRCPSKISWLRRELGLGADPVVVLRARTTGVTAVWATGHRHRDGQRPAVLAAAPGVEEDHAVWLATPDQIAVLDRCEGRDDRFRLARLPIGNAGAVPAAPEGRARRIEVRTEDGARVDGAWCYLGLAATRRPLLVDGRPVRCADVPQAVARCLRGEPATGDGIAAGTAHGRPCAEDWPAALFTYGLLQPGQPAWHLVAPHAAGAPRPGSVPGAVLDTGRGYPAWSPTGSGETPGMVVPLRDPAALLPVLDAYEGPDYRRVRTVVPADGAVCWAYAWRSPTRGFIPLPAGWADRTAP